MKIVEIGVKERKPEFDINPLIVGRWSSRAMSGEEIDHDELMSLFEAAKWAPSSYNGQPWRFIYAKRNTADWERLYDLLGEGNKSWAKNGSVLMVLISKKISDEGEPYRVHSFDAGSAFENMALEAVSRDLVIHPLEGFDNVKAAKVLEVPDEYEVEIMIVVGKRGKTSDLPPQLAEREGAKGRKALKELIMEGKFRK